MKVKELIDILSKIDKDRDVSVIIGNEDDNILCFDEFEVHRTDDETDETSVEIFCFWENFETR